MKGKRKLVMYFVTFGVCMLLNIVQIIKGQNPITFDGNFVWLLFSAVVLGNVGEHLSNINKKGD